MPILNVPPPYRGPTLGQGEVPVTGRTVRECLESAERAFPGFRDQVLDPAGKVHRFVRLFVRGNAVDPARIDDPVGESDEIRILAAIAGG